MIGKWMAAAAAWGMTGAPAREQGAPDEAAVKTLIAGDRGDLTWHWVTIGAGHGASPWEARQFETEPGRMLYPVRVAYSVPAASGPARDYVATYYVFRSTARRGRWDLSSNQQKGDVAGVLRAA